MACICLMQYLSADVKLPVSWIFPALLKPFDITHCAGFPVPFKHHFNRLRPFRLSVRWESVTNTKEAFRSIHTTKLLLVVVARGAGRSAADGTDNGWLYMTHRKRVVITSEKNVCAWGNNVRKRIKVLREAVNRWTWGVTNIHTSRMYNITPNDVLVNTSLEDERNLFMSYYSAVIVSV